MIKKLGLVQQNGDGDPDCFTSYCKLMGAEYNLRGGGSVSEGGSRGVVCPRLDQLRHLRVHAREAKGPTYGRYLASLLIREEDEFCMQIDSHMDFVNDYDTKLTEMWSLTEVCLFLKD